MEISPKNCYYYMDQFKIYLDRLKDGHIEKIEEKISPDFIELSEQELTFPDEVSYSGEAYLSNGFFILHLKIFTSIIIPCLICNEKVKTPLVIDDFYHTEKLSELRKSVFDFKNELRSALLIKVPAYFECHGGQCPERELITKYLKQ